MDRMSNFNRPYTCAYTLSWSHRTPILSHGVWKSTECG